MKLKTLSLFTLGLAAISAFILLKNQGNPPATAMPSYPINNDLISQSKRIELKADDGSMVVLETDDSHWYLPDYHQMPVDFSKLGRLVNNLLENDVQRVISSNPETLKRLNLGRKSLRLSEGQNTLLEIQFGKSGNNGGIFAQMSGSPEAVLLKNNISLDTRLKDWADSSLLNELKGFQHMSIKNAEGLFEYSKTEEKDWKDQDGVAYDRTLPEGLLNAITNLRIEDIEDMNSETVAKALDKTIEFQLKVDDDRCWTLRLNQPKPKSNESEESDTEAISPSVSYAQILVDKAQKPWENNLSTLAFKVPEYQANQIRQASDKLLQAKPNGI